MVCAVTELSTKVKNQDLLSLFACPRQILDFTWLNLIYYYYYYLFIYFFEESDVKNIET